MKPRYIRFVVPSNTSSQCNVPLQCGIRLISIQPSTCLRNSTPPCQIINKIEHAVPATTPSPTMLSSTRETMNLSNGIVSEEITSLPVPVSPVETFPRASSPSTNMHIDKLNTIDAVSKSDSSRSIFFVIILSVAFFCKHR